jgi:hypothetical protein
MESEFFAGFHLERRRPWLKMNKGIELCEVLAPEVIEFDGETIDNKLKNKFLMRFKPAPRHQSPQ